MVMGLSLQVLKVGAFPGQIPGEKKRPCASASLHSIEKDKRRVQSSVDADRVGPWGSWAPSARFPRPPSRIKSLCVLHKALPAPAPAHCPHTSAHSRPAPRFERGGWAWIHRTGRSQQPQSPRPPPQRPPRPPQAPQKAEAVAAPCGSCSAPSLSLGPRGSWRRNGARIGGGSGSQGPEVPSEARGAVDSAPRIPHPPPRGPYPPPSSPPPPPCVRGG